VTDLAQRFLNREPISGVLFQHNECVRITAGEHSGARGWLVTVLGLDPEPKFVLELESSGHAIQVLQLMRADS
jgi:hypothetical protein